MTVRFKRAAGGRVDATLGETEIGLLRELSLQLLALLDEGAEPARPTGGATLTDPDDLADLAAAVGIGTATEPPEDPALARLLPDAYPDDREAAAEFRRYTEEGLREQKRAAVRTLMLTLGEPDTKVRLRPDEAQAWLGALNDMRLALGTRLGVTEDLDELVAELDDDDPRLYQVLVYDHLTGMQELLVRALS